MKFTLIGQDIPMLLPTLLTDLLFAGKERDAEIVLEEKNGAMAELLTGYGEVILKKAGLGGSIRTTGNREEALRGADCVLYAGDPQAASRFFMDRAALESGNEKKQLTVSAEDKSRLYGFALGGTVSAGETGGTISGLSASSSVSLDALYIEWKVVSSVMAHVSYSRG